MGDSRIPHGLRRLYLDQTPPTDARFNEWFGYPSSGVGCWTIDLQGSRSNSVIFSRRSVIPWWGLCPRMHRLRELPSLHTYQRWSYVPSVRHRPWGLQWWMIRTGWCDKLYAHPIDSLESPLRSPAVYNEATFGIVFQATYLFFDLVS